MRLTFTRCMALGVASCLSIAGPATFQPASGATGRSPAAQQPSRSVAMTDLHLVGSATYTPSGRVRLVQAGQSDIAGAAYTPAKVDVTSFTVKLVFHMTGACADGLAFIVHGLGESVGEAALPVSR